MKAAELAAVLEQQRQRDVASHEVNAQGQCNSALLAAPIPAAWLLLQPVATRAAEVTHCCYACVGRCCVWLSAPGRIKARGCELLCYVPLPCCVSERNNGRRWGPGRRLSAVALGAGPRLRPAALAR